MANTRVAISLSFAFFLSVAHGARITLFNNCPYNVWPASEPNANSAILSPSGFELPGGVSNSIDVLPPWSGKFWARTGCSENNGVFSCVTADCGNVVNCKAGEATPASLMEFTIAANGGQDFYDVSNVDGFNIPSSITPWGVSKACNVVSCPANINAACPSELQLKGSDGSVYGCKSACGAFGTPEYCCSGDHNTPQTCPATNYSTFFSNQCPNANSYAYDDKIGTCSGSPNYIITFCP